MDSKCVVIFACKVHCANSFRVQVQALQMNVWCNCAFSICDQRIVSFRFECVYVFAQNAPIPAASCVGSTNRICDIRIKSAR